MEAGGCAPRLVSLPGIAWRAADQRKSHELALGFALRGFICFLRSLSFPAPPEVSRVLGQFRATWKLGGAFRSLGAQAPASKICSGQPRTQLFLACGEGALRCLCAGPLSELRGAVPRLRCASRSFHCLGLPECTWKLAFAHRSLAAARRRPLHGPAFWPAALPAISGLWRGRVAFPLRWAIECAAKGLCPGFGAHPGASTVWGCRSTWKLAFAHRSLAAVRRRPLHGPALRDARAISRQWRRASWRKGH